MLMRWFFVRFVTPYWFWYVGGIIALGVTNFVNLQIPLLAKSIVNTAAQISMDQNSMQFNALLIAVLGALTIFVRTISRILIFWPGRKLEADSKIYFFDKLIDAKKSFLIRHGLGDLQSRITNDIGQLRAFYAFGVLQLLNLVFLSVFTINSMLHVHLGLTLVCLGPLIIMVMILKPTMQYMHKISLENHEAMGALSNKITEAFLHVHVIQANAAEHTFTQRAQPENFKVYQSNMKAVLTRVALFPLMNLLINVSQIVVLFYGGHQVMNGKLSAGDILAFNIYIAYLGFPLSAMGIVLSLFQRCNTALKRLHEIEKAPSENHLLADTTVVTPKFDVTKPILKISNLNFNFDGELSSTVGSSRANVLSAIDFSIYPQEHVGLFGALGSGKSTLFSCITRLIEPSPGTIFYRGVDITTIHPKVLRSEISYAPQAIHLFSQSISENLKLGLGSKVTMDAVTNSARDAEILDEILEFPEQWQTQIGEKGIRLSGGQKQRLALARLCLRNPALILLDDAFSAVDQKTERQLIEFFKNTKQSILMASNRIEALLHCNRILIMEKGRIVHEFSPSEFEKFYHRQKTAKGAVPVVA